MSDTKREDPHVRMSRLIKQYGRTPSVKEWFLDGGFSEETATEVGKVMGEHAREQLRKLRQ